MVQAFPYPPFDWDAGGPRKGLDNAKTCPPLRAARMAGQGLWQGYAIRLCVALMI